MKNEVPSSCDSESFVYWSHSLTSGSSGIAILFVREFHRSTRLCFTLLGSFGVTTTPALSATTNPPSGRPIPWNQLGSQATAQDSGDGLAVNATDGARLRCVFQKLEAEVTATGLWLRSTATGANAEFSG